MAVLYKHLTATDCCSKLTLPTNFHILINGGSGGGQLTVRDADTNEMYNFVLAVRSVGYEKPVFQSAEWLDFVRRRELQAGNPIFFSKDEMNPGGFKIRPFFTFQQTEPLCKQLTTTDCNSAFPVPLEFHAFINDARPGSDELSVRDVQTNQMYNFVLEFPRGRNYPPVFQAEAWLDFVNRKGLEAGDQIYFFTDETNAGGFKIQVLVDFLRRWDSDASSTSAI